MAYALKISNTQPAIYIGVKAGFIEKVASESEALQFNRINDANAFATILIDTTESVVVS